MGVCCVLPSKPTASNTLPPSERETLKAITQSVSFSLRIKRKTLSDLKESAIRLEELMKTAQQQAKDVSQSLNDRFQSLQRIHLTCIQLLTRISILHSLAINIKSAEFRPLLRAQSIEEVTSNLLSLDYRPSQSMLIAEIKSTTFDQSQSDSDAVNQLKREKSEAKGVGESLISLKAARTDCVLCIQGLTQQREDLLRNCVVFNTQLLLLKDSKQQALVHCCGYEEELVKDVKISPVTLLEGLLALESEIFTLNTEVAGTQSSLQQSKAIVEVAARKAEQCDELLSAVTELPVPIGLSRASPSLRAIPPKQLSEGTLSEPLDRDSEERIQSMYDEAKMLEKRLQAARESQERARKLSMKLEEQLESNDFQRAELVLRLVARRLEHRMRCEKMMLFGQWRLESI